METNKVKIKNIKYMLPNYSIKISTDKGPTVKTVTRDKLKLVKNPELYNVLSIEMPRSNIPDPGSRTYTINLEHSSSDGSSVEDNNGPERRYNSRPRNRIGRVYNDHIIQYCKADLDKAY